MLLSVFEGAVRLSLLYFTDSNFWDEFVMNNPKSGNLITVSMHRIYQRYLSSVRTYKETCQIRLFYRIDCLRVLNRNVDKITTEFY